MTDTKQDKAEHLIIEFLDKHDKPTVDDWKHLTELYPQYAAAFADAALVRAIGDVADTSAEEYSFDEVLANKTVSRALSKASQLQSANLEAAAMKVAGIRSPAARRETAIAVGIGSYPALLNGVLTGRTLAPGKILRALEQQLEIPVMALRELFARLFAASVVPSFKAGDVKPQVAAEPATWEEAVRGLALSEEETQRLLKFSEED